MSQHRFRYRRRMYFYEEYSTGSIPEIEDRPRRPAVTIDRPRRPELKASTPRTFDRRMNQIERALEVADMALRALGTMAALVSAWRELPKGEVETPAQLDTPRKDDSNVIEGEFIETSGS